MSKPTKTFKHLQEYERHIIEALWKKQTSMRGIAIILDRSPNTISRELKRREIYQAKKAQRHAFFKRYRSKQCCMKVAMNAFLNRFVREKLHDKWSPKQMSGYLKHQDISISSKAIYKFIGKRGMNHLLFWGRNHHKRGKKAYRYNQVPDDRKYIEERPNTLSLGHYEMDFIVSKKSAWVLLVVVDRMSKQTFVEKLPNRKRTTIHCALSKIFRGKPLHSITTDNDIAFSNWKQIEVLLSTQIYFCHPYHSWEKGLVENTNRWIREFVSKKRHRYGD
jgi:IS30 family transposase